MNKRKSIKRRFKFCSVCRGLLTEDQEIKRGTHDHCANDIYDCDEDHNLDDATQSHGQDDSI
jgi:hypothetical protein